MNDISVISVSQLNTYVKSILESDRHLNKIYISGEISNFTHHYSSGHFYLTLKDDKCAVKAVMFRTVAQKVPFTPENGMKVICRGRVSLFERDGAFQLYIEDMQPDGIGSLQLAFEQLKIRLAEAGLFDEKCKRPIPKYPSRIAVITAPGGAALQDILNIISRRYPLAEIILCPAAVQGETAVPTLIEAMRKVNSLGCADVIIIGRGGGSIEDLWAFNDEKLAYAIFESNIPVISAVGHEVDFTICDFVADLRAPTPSAAAELAVPDIAEIAASLSSFRAALTSGVTSLLRDYGKRLELIASRRCFCAPQSFIDVIAQKVDFFEHRIKVSAVNMLDGSASKLGVAAAKIDALSPLKTLARGYSIATNHGKVVKCADDINESDSIELLLKDGSAVCTVESVTRRESNG